jgi:hypothetical protein
MIMKTRAAIISGFIFALAACADTAGKPSVTAPSTAPTVAPSLDLADAPTEDGAIEAGTSAEVVALSTVDAEAEAESRAAAGARASGHAEVVSIFGGAISKYSFIVLTTSPVRIGGPFFPYFPAKGEVQGTIVQTVAGVTVTETIHADINCANFVNIPIPIFGRMAIASGPIKHWVRDGQPVPFPPGHDVLLTVQDNGEGRDSPPDRASSLIPVGGRLNCRDLFLRMFPSEQGNIQVVFPGERGNSQDQK